MYQKIDKRGQYTVFRGITMLAGINSQVGQEANIWKQMYHALCLSKSLKTYFSFLPYQSYHVTTGNLVTEEDYPGWNDYLNTHLDFYQRLHQILQEQSFNLEIKIQGVHLGSTIQLIVDIPEAQMDALHAIAKETGLGSIVPSPLHMTLAYGFKAVEEENTWKVLEEEINKIISPLRDKTVFLESIRLCIFKDMKKFIPWDGKQNPFDKTSKLSLNIFQKEPKKPLQESVNIGCNLL